MKHIFAILFFFLLSSLCAQGDNYKLDTVFCDTKNTSYIIFNEDVTLIDVGNPEDYAAQVKGNIVFIKALKQNLPSTTVLIKTGKSIYFGMIMYKASNKKYYYDFSLANKKETNDKQHTPEFISKEKNAPALKEEKQNADTQFVTTDNVLKEKMSEVAKIKSEISTLGFISSSVDAAVTVIRNDNTSTFLKIVFKNKSTLPYKLDFISFQYFQDMKKGTLKKSKKAPLDVFPLGEPGITEIAPGKSESLVYVIPSYALSNKGYLMVLVRETNGDRVLKIKIEGSVIQNSPQLILNGKQ